MKTKYVLVIEEDVAVAKDEDGGWCAAGMHDGGFGPTLKAALDDLADRSEGRIVRRRVKEGQGD